MTYDERREIEDYLKIVERNCERTLRSIDMMRSAIEKISCDDGSKKFAENAKEKFLSQC